MSVFWRNLLLLFYGACRFVDFLEEVNQSSTYSRRHQLYRKYFQTKRNISLKLLMKTFQLAAKRFVYEYLLGFEFNIDF